MKKIVLAVLIILLLALTFPSIPKVSATTTEDLWITQALPEEIPREPTSDSPSGDYLNTTNPYADIAGIPEAWDELDEAEGDNPLYVLVFADEEERPITRAAPATTGVYIKWTGWAKAQLERGDEALVENFGIDIRILGFLEWDSDDSKDSMYDLWYELESDTEQYLGEWYSGEAWSDYVDAVIGITAQVNHGPAGLSPPPQYLDQGRNFVLLRWQVYWADDNLVMHEVSHLFYAPDHNQPCCAMADHTHFVGYTWEDKLWIILAHVECSYTIHEWCDDCYQVIYENRYKYLVSFWLTISSMAGGTTSPSPGTYEYLPGASVTVTAIAFDDWEFKSWYRDQHEENRKVYYDNPVTFEMDDDHTLTAYFNYLGGGGGGDPMPCPTLFAWNGSDYVDLGVIDIHADEDVVREVSVPPESVGVNEHKAQFRLREGWEGLTYSHSQIDQVKLHAVDSDGNRRLCPLVNATHSELGNVLPQLLQSDDTHIDLYLLETIDLTFALPAQTDEFVFVIEGCNMVKR